MPTPSVRNRALSILLTAFLLLFALPVAVPPATATDQPQAAQTECSATYHLGDRRFGPETLPNTGIVGFELTRYRRTGDLTPQQFLEKYWDPAASWWRYPPLDGYLLDRDGKPIIIPVRLRAGQYIDRYGSEFGQFLAPIGTSYAGRSIPPQSLVSTPAGYCNYRAYRVLKPFKVDSGPIAPWFEQSGMGWQYVLKGNHIPGAPTPLTVKWLLENGYLARVIGPPQALAERNLPQLDRAPVF